MVAFGRTKGYRGSYVQFREGGVAPQVGLEILSPGELARKRAFYQRYGVEDYYLTKPDKKPAVKGWVRDGDRLRNISDIESWVSPRLRIRIERSNDDLRVISPDGRAFETYEDLSQRAQRLAEKLRSLGIDPDV